MNANHNRLASAALLLLLATALCVALPRRAAAQESGAASPGGLCPAAADFENPLNTPHWNGWGADVAQHRFQPAAMAGLAADDVPRLSLKWAFGVPGATRMVAQPI